jgi:hypothetical protein
MLCILCSVPVKLLFAYRYLLFIYSCSLFVIVVHLLCSLFDSFIRFVVRFQLHSLTGPVGQPFASHLGGQRGTRPRDAPTITIEPGSPVSDVLLHW